MTDKEQIKALKRQIAKMQDRIKEIQERDETFGLCKFDNNYRRKYALKIKTWSCDNKVIGARWWPVFVSDDKKVIGEKIDELIDSLNMAKERLSQETE